MKNTFLITTLLATTALATSAWADDITYATCTGCTSCGYMCKYTWSGTSTGKITIYAGEGATMRNDSRGIFSDYGSYLRTVEFHGDLTNIANNAFRNNPGLSSVVIPDTVTSIGENAFSGSMVSYLSKVVIGDSVATIGASAFYGQERLTSLVIGTSVTDIGNWAFYNMPKSAEVYCPNADCRTKVKNAGYKGSNFVEYTKIDDSIYQIGTAFYTSATDMQNKSNVYTSLDECKEAKAEQLATDGVLCQTTQGCLNLMNMVSNENYECTSLKTCQVVAAGYGVNLAATVSEPEPEVIPSGGTGGSDGQDAPKRRIYTVQEATDRVKELGTETVNFRIRYK